MPLFGPALSSLPETTEVIPPSDGLPEGAIVGRIAWSHVPSEENNKTFGRDQSFVAGAPTDAYLQFMVKDSKKYAATGGWGYSSFGKDGKPTDVASMQKCFPCHQAIESRDFIFTRYSP